MKKINGIINDFIKCMIIGTLIALGIIFVIGIISLLILKFNFIQSLQIVRSSLLIIGPLGIMLGALLILKKRDEKQMVFIGDWEKKYKVLSYRVVLILVSIVIVLYGGIIDWLIFTII